MSHEQARDDARKAVLAAAQEYLERGWQPIPVPHKSKNPNRKGWQNERRTVTDLEEAFGRKLVNLGILTGDPSGGLIDVDVDSTEALRLASTFLPETDAVFGRDGKPTSHWLYIADASGDTEQFEAPGGGMLAEYRATGTQTIFPPSFTSELVRWEKTGEPRRIDAALLRQQVGRLAAASLLAQFWPAQGSRHAASLALTGGLLRARWTEDEVAEFLVAVASAADDEEAQDRVADVRTTAERLANGEPATGWNSLRQILGEAVVQKVQRWLGVSARADREPSGSERRGQSGLYEERNGKLFWLRPSRDGTTAVQLANFTARIVADIVTDDGADRRRAWEIEARLGDRVARGTVPIERFANLGWAVELLGAGAVVSAGSATRDHARAAIQTLSNYTTARYVYAHLGWRQIGGEWVYLHAGGAIGKAGVVDGVEVAPPSMLARYVLPLPETAEELRDAIRASLAMLDVAPDHVSAPPLAGTYRAPLGPMDGGIHLVGLTGVGKSELGALAQQHFGAGLDRTHLPASWSSTANALEALAFVAKDCLLTVDDFAPSGSQYDIQRYHRDAERLFRAQGNNAGRQRLNADATLRGSKYPRGVILSTGEDSVRGQSARARVLNVEVARDSVRFDLLAEHQRSAADGLLALAMAGYVRWMAGRYDQIQKTVRERLIELRGRAHDSQAHRRTPDLIANLAVGWETWLTYAAEVGAITEAERQQLWQRAWRGLGQAASQQNAQQQAAEPTRRFLDLLLGAIASGAAHVAGPDGHAPSDPAAWGWRDRSDPLSQFPSNRWHDQGSRIGWIDADGLYLEPQASYTVAQKFGASAGEPLVCGQRMLSRHLFERNLLVRSERERDRYTVRRDLEGRRRNVLHLRRDVLDATSAESTAQTAQTAPTAEPGAAPSWNDAPRGPFSGVSSATSTDETAHNNGPDEHRHQENADDHGPSGPFGPSAGREPSGNGERFIRWRCTGCRAYESWPHDGGGRQCAGCGARTDDAGRVQCEVCGSVSEDGRRRRCVGCAGHTGDAA